MPTTIHSLGILRSLAGTVHNIVFHLAQNGLVFTERAAPRDTPATLQYILVGILFATASRHWRSLADSQREDWNAYAAKHFPTDAQGTEEYPSGFVVFLRAAWHRHPVGQDLPRVAPILPRPIAPNSIELLGSEGRHSLHIRVGHSIANIAEHRLLVEITQSLGDDAAEPTRTDYWNICGVTDRSLPPLGKTSAEYRFSRTQFPIPPGSRFGCRATTISPEGIPSKSFTAILVRPLQGSPIS